MYKLSQRSLNNLIGVHPKLANVFKEAIKTAPLDFMIICGVRSLDAQQKAFKEKTSKCDGIIKKSKHQKKPDGYGYAVDAVPYPINWDDKKKFKNLSAHIKATAKKMGVKIVWGGDWGWDMPHYELA